MADAAMPELLADLATMINRMPVGPKRDLWKRLRIAVTPDEIAEMRKFFFQDSDRFVHAVRGVPLVQEEFPQDPVYCMEFPDVNQEITSVHFSQAQR
jgi:hypothetical protein